LKEQPPAAALQVLPGELSAQPVLPRLVVPLLQRWASLGMYEPEQAPLMECLCSLAQASGQQFETFASPVFSRWTAAVAAGMGWDGLGTSAKSVQPMQPLILMAASLRTLPNRVLRRPARCRCLEVAAKQMEAQALPPQQQQQQQQQQQGVPRYEATLLQCALDCLAGLVEGLGASVEPLVSASQLMAVVLQCCRDDASGVGRRWAPLLASRSRLCPRCSRRAGTDLLQLD
jgi:hypothetical protein